MPGIFVAQLPQRCDLQESFDGRWAEPLYNILIREVRGLVPPESRQRSIESRQFCSYILQLWSIIHTIMDRCKPLGAAARARSPIYIGIKHTYRRLAISKHRWCPPQPRSFAFPLTSAFSFAWKTSRVDF